MTQRDDCADGYVVYVTCALLMEQITPGKKYFVVVTTWAPGAEVGFLSHQIDADLHACVYTYLHDNSALLLCLICELLRKGGTTETRAFPAILA